MNITCHRGEKQRSGQRRRAGWNPWKASSFCSPLFLWSRSQLSCSLFVHTVLTVTVTFFLVLMQICINAEMDLHWWNNKASSKNSWLSFRHQIHMFSCSRILASSSITCNKERNEGQWETGRKVRKAWKRNSMTAMTFIPSHEDTGTRDP